MDLRTALLDAAKKRAQTVDGTEAYAERIWQAKIEDEQRREAERQAQMGECRRVMEEDQAAHMALAALLAREAKKAASDGC